MLTDEMQYLLVRGDDGLWHALQSVRDMTAWFQMAQRKFTNYKGMYQDLTSIKQLSESGVAPAQMIDPNRGVDQNHLGGARRRLGATNRGWLPPKRAMRRAASRSMSALSASRTKADFSFTPVKACALFISSSSSAKVVRMSKISQVQAHI
jgi:hypothetical protein